MEDVRDRVAVVTGGGSGIGRGLVLALVEAGADVAAADIDVDAAKAVAEEASARGVRALAVRTDVSEASSMAELARTVEAELGAVHILCLNAGAFLSGPVIEMTRLDWEWVLSVNLMGMVNGIDAFLPGMIERGGPAHIVLTSSVEGLSGRGTYSVSKVAVLAVAESLHAELQPRGIGVSVLLPAYVNSRILDAQRNRPARYGPKAAEPLGSAPVTTGIDPVEVGRRALEAIRHDELYVFAVPPGWEERLRPSIETRAAALTEALERGAISA